MLTQVAGMTIGLVLFPQLHTQQWWTGRTKAHETIIGWPVDPVDRGLSQFVGRQVANLLCRRSRPSPLNHFGTSLGARIRGQPGKQHLG